MGMAITQRAHNNHSGRLKGQVAALLCVCFAPVLLVIPQLQNMLELVAFIRPQGAQVWTVKQEQKPRVFFRHVRKFTASGFFKSLGGMGLRRHQCLNCRACVTDKTFL
jgi:hypothetical protein